VKIAWFRERPLDGEDAADDTVQAIRQLGQTHEIELITRAGAHDFVWKHFRAPYDLTVFELLDEAGASFIAAYAAHYGGVTIVSGAFPHSAAGARALRRACAAARLLIARDEASAARLHDEHPTIPVRAIPPGWGSDRGQIGVRSVSGSGSGTGSDPVRFAVVGRNRDRTAANAMRRAQEAGAHARLVPTPDAADVVLALAWPPDGEPLMPALAAMAAGQAVVVFETEVTAGWPALDGHTWRPRPGSSAEPIVVSIDPRDEEHSLTMAIKRLAGDAPLRNTLAAAGHAWWQSHATAAHSLARWRAVMDEAIAAPPPAPLPDLLDGSATARRILAELGVSVDLFPQRPSHPATQPPSYPPASQL